MKKYLLPLMTIALLFTTAFVGCKKEVSDSLSGETEEQAAIASSESQAESELVFNDVFDNVVGVNADLGIGGTGVFQRTTVDAQGREMDLDSSARCFTVTVAQVDASTLFPVKVTIDFGAGCTGRDGHTRYGKIITVFTGRLIKAGSSATTTFEGFRIDSISVQGTHKITNTTATTQGSNQQQFTVEVTDAKLSKPNGNYSQWHGKRVITQIEGNGTVSANDDVYSIEGAAEGRVKRGDLVIGWQAAITTALIKKFTCRWISKGTVKTRRDTLPSNSPWVAVLDYGTGSCDNEATLTVNGNVRVIHLPL